MQLEILALKIQQIVVFANAAKISLKIQFHWNDKDTVLFDSQNYIFINDFLMKA